MIGRIAVTRISKWLERLILPGQDTLVDAPHLVSRYPSLLKEELTDIVTWNKTARFGSYIDLGLDHRKIEEFRFKKSCWLSRPTWFWRGLSECQKIKEVSAPWEKKSTDFAFCEDDSKFHKREECKEFIAESDSPYVQRFVFGFEDVDYRPKVRLIASTKRSLHDSKE